MSNAPLDRRRQRRRLLLRSHICNSAHGSYPTHRMASEDFCFFVTAGDNGKLKRARDNTNAAVANIRRSTSTSKKLKTKDTRMNGNFTAIHQPWQVILSSLQRCNLCVPLRRCAVDPWWTQTLEDMRNGTTAVDPADHTCLIHNAPSALGKRYAPQRSGAYHYHCLLWLDSDVLRTIVDQHTCHSALQLPERTASAAAAECERS